MSSSSRARLARRICATVALLGLGFFIGHALFGLGSGLPKTFFADWIYDSLIMGGAISCLVRAWLVPRERLAWAVLGLGLASDAAGEIYYSVVFGDSGTPPIPSVADLLYLLYYPAAYTALVMIVRGRVPRLSPSTWLDGAIAATTSAAVIAALAFEPILQGATHGDAAAVATNLAYPVFDLILLAIVLGMFGLSGWRPGRDWLLLGMGLALSAIGDTGYLYESANGTYVTGGILDSLWIASALAMGFAAWQPGARRLSVTLEGKRLVVIPGLFALAALSVLVYGGFHHVGTIGLVLAAIAVLLVFIRAAWTYTDNVRLLRSVRRDAVTDALTGLGNRRAMLAELEEMLADGRAAPAAVLAMFDLDGFKLYNDTFGHVAGDTLLAHFGRRLLAALPEHTGQVYRLGGDEFCALLRCESTRADVHIAALVTALTAEGEGFSVGTSCGTVTMPLEAPTAGEALQLADERLYGQKRGRRGSAGHQTHSVLMSVLHEREPALHEHLQHVGRMAWHVGNKLGIRGEALDELVRAAELHDIGKAAIPDAILDKPGPLDDDEWTFMRRHTLVGERILASAPALAPVGRIVRASHERWDGRGYPDGIAGEEIPLAARVVFVCDAFDAITSRRPYAEPRTHDHAIDTLRSGAGTQFDPAVVEAFAAVWAELRGQLSAPVYTHSLPS